MTAPDRKENPGASTKRTQAGGPTMNTETTETRQERRRQISRGINRDGPPTPQEIDRLAAEGLRALRPCERCGDPIERPRRAQKYHPECAAEINRERSRRYWRKRGQVYNARRPGRRKAPDTERT